MGITVVERVTVHGVGSHTGRPPLGMSLGPGAEMNIGEASLFIVDIAYVSYNKIL